MRVYKFIKYLNKKNVILHVICNNWDIQLAISQDKKLSQELKGVKFHSVPAFGRNRNNIKNNNNIVIHKTNYKVKLLKLFSNLIQPDFYSFSWNKRALKKANQIIVEFGIKNIITTSPPHSSQLIGLELKKIHKNKINWIVDFRDMWSLSHTFPHGFSIRKFYNRYLEKIIIKKSDKLIFVSDGIKNHTLTKFKLINLMPKAYVIHNGYDTDDFNNIHQINLSNNEKFIFSYIGSMFGPQTNHKLFEGIISFANTYDDLNDVGFNFIGEFDTKVKNYSNDKNHIKFLEKKSHEEALCLMNSSDILILVLPNDFEGSVAYSGKFFEYLKIGKPILAIVPTGEVSNIVYKYKLGEVANPDDVNEISEKIIKILSNYSSYLKIPPIELEKYSRDFLTNKLLNIINE